MNRNQWWGFAAIFFLMGIVLHAFGNFAYELSMMTGSEALFLTRTIDRTAAFVFYGLAFGFLIAGYFENKDVKKK